MSNKNQPNYVSAAARPLRSAQRAITIAIISVLAIVLVDWQINVHGGAIGMGINAMLATILGVFALLLMYGPSRLIEAAGLGTAFYAINLRNPIDGAGWGLKIHNQITIIFLLGLVGMHFLLATVPFGKDPFGFWYIMSGAFVILLVMLAFRIPTNKFIPLVVIVFIAIAMAGRAIYAAGMPLISALPALAIPAWMIYAALAVAAVVALVVFDKKLPSGVKFILTTAAVVLLAMATYSWFTSRGTATVAAPGATSVSSTSSGAGGQLCSRAAILVTPGTRITVPKHCSVLVDQYHMQKGFETRLSNVELRRQTGDQLNYFVNVASVGRITGRPRDQHVFMLTPNPETFAEFGREEITVIVYAPGQSPELPAPLPARTAPAAGAVGYDALR